MQSGKEKVYIYFVSRISYEEAIRRNIVRVERIASSVCKSISEYFDIYFRFVFLNSVSSKYIPDNYLVIDPSGCRHRKAHLGEPYMSSLDHLEKMIRVDIKENDGRIKVFILSEGDTGVKEVNSPDLLNLKLCTDLRNEFPEIYIGVEVIDPVYYNAFEYVVDDVICARMVTDKITPNALLVRYYSEIIKNLIKLNMPPNIFTIQVNRSYFTNKFIGQKYGVVKRRLFNGRPPVNLIGLIISDKGFVSRYDTSNKRVVINPAYNSPISNIKKFERRLGNIFRKILLFEEREADIRQISFGYRIKEGDFLIAIACNYDEFMKAIISYEI